MWRRVVNYKYVSVSSERAESSFGVHCRGSRDLRNSENFYRATWRCVAEDSAVLGHHPNNFRFQLLLLQSMPIFYSICNVVFHLWFLFYIFQETGCLGLWIVTSAILKIQKVHHCISRDIKFYNVEGYQNIGSFKYKCCKKSYWILPKKTAFNSSVTFILISWTG